MATHFIYNVEKRIDLVVRLRDGKLLSVNFNDIEKITDTIVLSSDQISYRTLPVLKLKNGHEFYLEESMDEMRKHMEQCAERVKAWGPSEDELRKRVTELEERLKKSDTERKGFLEFVRSDPGALETILDEHAQYKKRVEELERLCERYKLANKAVVKDNGKIIKQYHDLKKLLVKLKIRYSRVLKKNAREYEERINGLMAEKELLIMQNYHAYRATH